MGIWFQQFLTIQLHLLIIILFMQKDPFGFQTQGVNYESFRPRYPKKLIQKILINLKNKNKYLDIATGTGILLFNLASNFKKSVGTDVSQKMLEVCKQKAQKYNLSDLEVYQKDCLQTFNQKFDLVTIGQALHFLPLPNTIEHIAKNLLDKDGRFVCFSYYVQGIQELQGGPVKSLFDDFYGLVKRQFDFDRDQIHREYSDAKYTWNQNFESVQKQVLDEIQTMPSENFLGYMKTFSGYNRYKQKYPEKQDPIIALEQGLKNHKNVNMKIRYFGYYCDRPKFV